MVIIEHERVIYWHDVKAKIRISQTCGTVGIRPYIPFLLKTSIFGFDPYTNFEEFLITANDYDFRAKYHRACINAYFNGDMKTVRIFTQLKCLGIYNR